MRRAGLVLLLAGLGAPAAAQEALYGPQPPPGSAYVRFVNATAAPLAVRPDFLPAQRLGIAEGDRVGPYAVVVAAGARALGLALQGGGRSASATLHVAPDSFDTVLVRTDAAGAPVAVVIAEGAAFDQARARLSFFNATADCGDGSVSLLPQGAVVFAGVPPGEARSRTVYPVQATLRTACADGSAEVNLTGMAAGGSTSVWLMRAGGRAVAFMTKDAVLPYAQ